MTRVRLQSAALCFLVLTGCATAPPEQTLEDYVAEIEEYRTDRVERLKSSWLTIAGLYWLEPGDNPFGSGVDNAVVFPAGSAPEHAGKFIYSDGAVTLVPASGVEVAIDGQAVGETSLTAGDEAKEATLGRLTFWVIERAGRHAIRLRDPEYRALREFHGIDFYPIDRAHALDGLLVPYDEPRTVSIETVIGYDAEMTSKGRVEFDLLGETHSLEALVSSPDADSLFLIFKDATSGDQTYGAGRYLYAPFEGTSARIDFNKAYNPPCAFTPNATCPLPPSGNTLKISIEAGERDYHLD